MTRGCKWQRRILVRLHRGERLACYLPEGEEPAGTSVEEVCVKNDVRHPCPFPTVALCLADVAAPNVAMGEETLVEGGDSVENATQFVTLIISPCTGQNILGLYRKNYFALYAREFLIFPISRASSATRQLVSP